MRKAAIGSFIGLVILAMRMEGGAAETNVNNRAVLRSRVDKVLSLKWPEQADDFINGARAIETDYPKAPNGYELMMMAIDNYQFQKQTDKARALAKEMAISPAPEKFRTWASGVLYRFDALGKPLSFGFTAVDGREVDLAKLRGKVVLIDFWATGCGPCIAELPRVKAAFDQLNARGFEVIGISCDTDKERLARFIQEKGYPWPQYFDGHQQPNNKFAQEFGIDGIPHMFLVDRRGVMRIDNVRAGDGFEDQIKNLLSEPAN